VHRTRNKRRKWGMNNARDPNHNRGSKVQDVIKKPELWRKLVREQARFIKSLIRTKKRDRSYIYFGDFQHPEIAGMFGRSGSKAFCDARERWVADACKILDESVLDRLARAI
jgi:hypothetical protein